MNKLVVLSTLVVVVALGVFVQTTYGAKGVNALTAIRNYRSKWEPEIQADLAAPEGRKKGKADPDVQGRWDKIKLIMDDINKSIPVYQRLEALKDPLAREQFEVLLNMLARLKKKYKTNTGTELPKIDA